jgi:hypothetical protein
MYFSVQKRPSRQHYRAAMKPDSDLGLHPNNPITLEKQVIDRLLEKPEVFLVLKPAAYRRTVQNPICLGAGRPHRGPFGRIQDSKLDAGFIGCDGHGATERINLLDQMPLTDAADRGITRHLPQGLDVLGQQQGSLAHARRDQRRFGACMATADDNNVKFCWKVHVKRRHPRQTEAGLYGDLLPKPAIHRPKQGRSTLFHVEQ